MSVTKLSPQQELKMVMQLKELDAQAARLRDELGYADPGETLFSAEHPMLDDRQIIVEADGYGGAAVLEVSGNYPTDFTEHARETRDTEWAAIRLGRLWAEVDDDEDFDDDEDEDDFDDDEDDEEEFEDDDPFDDDDDLLDDDDEDDFDDDEDFDDDPDEDDDDLDDEEDILVEIELGGES